MRVRPLTSIAAFASIFTLGSLGSAAELDPKTGSLVFAPDAVRTYGFESAADLMAAKVSLAKLKSGYPPTLTITPVTDPATVEPLLVEAGLQGKKALNVANGVGIAIEDASFFASIAKRRVSITFWGLANGTAPSLQVRYGKADQPIDTRGFAVVSTLRTGRETSDGWAEFTTGDIDGSVWGRPIRAITVTPSSSSKTGAFLVDAIEIRPTPGSVTDSKACTMVDVETTCGPTGDCLYGHCVSSSVTWGPMPSPAHRVELAERWIQLASRTLGDRGASAGFRAKLLLHARDLARYAISSRQFLGGMARVVNLLRDNHTSFGTPPAAMTSMSPLSLGAWSGGLHGCFGVGEDDLTGKKGRVFTVFDAGDKPLTSVVLKKGDVLVSIDGRDPKAWVDDVAPQIATTMPNDPGADWSSVAAELAGMITARANKIVVARCTSSTKCTGDDRKELSIDVSGPMFARIVAGGDSSIDYFICSNRFHDSVDTLDDAASGEDAVTVRDVGGVKIFQFDGFVNGPGWDGKFADGFASRPKLALMDTREGHGGNAQAVQVMLSLLRGADEPMGVLTVIRGGREDPDPASLFPDYEACATADGGSLACFGAWGFFADALTPTGGKTKIAWLNTNDVSANDFMPRLLKGRTNLRIFGPNPTAGAFGAITSLPSLLPGWSGGSMQYQDSRFGVDYASLPAARWESGHGVIADVTIAEKVSDAIDDRDTMLEAAKAWLAE